MNEVQIFRCPLGNGQTIIITGRVANDPWTQENGDAPVFELEALTWGYRIAGTNKRRRKTGSDVNVYVEGATVILHTQCEYNKECEEDATQAVFVNVPEGRDHWCMCIGHARAVCP